VVVAISALEVLVTLELGDVALTTASVESTVAISRGSVFSEEPPQATASNKIKQDFAQAIFISNTLPLLST
jgi:hypothetical protein